MNQDLLTDARLRAVLQGLESTIYSRAGCRADAPARRHALLERGPLEGALMGVYLWCALAWWPGAMCADILHVTRAPCGRLARVGGPSRVEWCFPKWAKVFCRLTCVLEAHTKITVLPPSV